MHDSDQLWCSHDANPTTGSRTESVIRHEGEGVGKPQLSVWVAAHLREKIISGKLSPGTFLRIDAIARELEISTTPVREGLLLLHSESYVRLMPRRGFIVNSFTKGDLRDLFWAQATICAQLAERATVLISSKEISDLWTLHQQHVEAVEMHDTEASAKLGHRFHRTINLAAQAPRLALLLGSLTKQLPNRFYANIEGQLEDAISYHPIILDAISVRDADAVRSLMFRHIVSGAEHLIGMLDRQGVWAALDQSSIPAAPDSRLSAAD